MAVDGNNKQIGPKQTTKELRYAGGRIVTPGGPTNTRPGETQAYHADVASRRRRPLGTGEGWKADR